MNVNDHVRVGAPFTGAFPGVYRIEALDGETATICGDRQFATSFLTLTEEPLQDYEAPRPAVPEHISAPQARAVLRARGLYDAVAALMAAPETDPVVKDFWEYEYQLDRASPALNAMAVALGLSQSDLDDMFIAGAQVRI